MKRIRCVTNDGINLIGFLYEGNNDAWNIMIPGVDGNIMTNEFVHVIGEELSNNGYNFILGHHRGSFQILSSNSLDPNISGITIGSVFEKFDDSKYDVEAWIKYAVDNGAKEINLITHSHGCNKTINYLANNHEYDEYIKKFILISPLDLRTRMNKRRELDILYDKANNIINTDSKDDFVCCGFFYKTGEGFMDMMENSNIDNFPMMSNTNNNFDIYNSININKYIVYGSYEKKYIDLFEQKREYLDSNTKILDVIDDASHIYQGKEKEIAEYIINILRG